MNQIFSFLSWRNWGIIRYNSTWQNISLCFFIILIERNFSPNVIGDFFLFLLFSTFTTAYGYLVNDLSDIELDKKHHKKNAFENTSLKKAIFITFSFLLIGCLFSIPFLNSPWFIFFFVLWVFVSTFYSLPPIRFKEKKLLGLILIVICQQTLPALLMLTAFSKNFNIGLASFILYATVRGFSSDTSHQMRDWKNDSKTKTKTFAVWLGVQKTQLVYALLLELEKLSYGLVIFSLFYYVNPLQFSMDIRLSPILPLLLIYLFLLIPTLGKSLTAYKQENLIQLDPYNETRQKQKTDFLQIIHHSFPSVFVPIYLSGFLALIYFPFSIFLIILLLLYGKPIISAIKRVLFQK